MKRKTKKFSLDSYQLYAFADEQIQPKKLLPKEQSRKLYDDIYKLTLEISALARIEKSIPENDKIKKSLKAIRNHAVIISSLIGNGINFLAILGENTTEEDFSLLQKFIDALPIVERSITISLKESSHKHKSKNTDIYMMITKGVADLLDKYKLKKTITTSGLWEKTINQIIKDAKLPPKKEIKNYMRQIQKQV